MSLKLPQAFGVAVAVVALLGNKGSQTLPPENDPFTFQFFVSAFDGDEADE